MLSQGVLTDFIFLPMSWQHQVCSRQVLWLPQVAHQASRPFLNTLFSISV